MSINAPLFWTNDPLQIVQAAEKSGEIIQGVVYKVEPVTVGTEKKERVTMDLGGVKGYCSPEEFDAHSYRTLAGFIGHTVDVIVTKIVQEDETGKECAIVSRRLANERKGERTKRTLKEGDIANGTISGFNDRDGKNTIFVNLGGVDAFCYLEDWDHVRVPHLRDAGILGQPVTVLVKKIVSEDPYLVRVSRREAIEDPWEGIEKEFPVGSNVLGKVQNIDPNYGIFVNLRRGVTILAEIPKRSNLPQPIPGIPVRGTLIAIDEKKRRGKMMITNYPHGAPTKRANPGSYLFE